ncbi:hypothetical protein [Pedobacter cryotolerans]|uniref:Uncharacterized protein n=1 Tax=Pedobacter cryotolerans TaxID=2571270 RepID=A0A4U1BW38_9SPHI|nr:hypothetical protein [Pedobacter cryotolerans]TKB96449.1 hypothetical protein FA045_18350 [Pedobacter cryotolerans]
MMFGKKQFLLVLLFGAFSLHLAHQLFPHHHHQPVIAKAHSHGEGSDHHHHHKAETNSKPQQDKNILDELLSLINHGKADSPVQSGSQIKVDYCKVISILPVAATAMVELAIDDYQLTSLGYTPPEHKPQQHVILFKSRRGPPAMA